ncbi:MAG: pyridoxal phosphate-dependent aminotransferase [Candidatus Omnitrophota bacterium]
MKLSSRVLQLKPSLTLAITSKAKALKKSGVDVISFGAGEPDFDTPSHIKEAAIESIRSGFTKYTEASGTLELKSAICDQLRSNNGLEYTTDQVVVSCGAKHALYNIFQVLCDRTDEVIVISPYWVSYPEMVHLSGAVARVVESKEEDGYIVDPGLLKKNITKRTKAIIINSPSNPTGAVYDKAVLENIADLAVSKKVFVISDEIYEALTYDGVKQVSIASLGKDIYDRTITVNGVSKSYSMTGWRIGYAAGPKDMIEKIGALQSHSTSNPTSISQKAALCALKGDQAVIGRMRAEFVSRRDYMVRVINSIKGMSCFTPKGAFYVFCNIEKTGLGSVALCERLLDDVHVACVPGAAFGSDKHIRLSFATGMENISKGLTRIGDWFKRL